MVAGDEVKTAILRIDAELLRQVLKLPDDIEIVDASSDFHVLGTVLLKLKGDSLPPVPDGCQIPYVLAEFHTVHHAWDETEFVGFR